jgi:hypothetical protein
LGEATPGGGQVCLGARYHLDGQAPLIATAAEHERVTAAVLIEIDAADGDLMIAARMGGLNGALEHRGGIGDQGAAAEARAGRDSGELVVTVPGEVTRQPNLIHGQHVHRETLRMHERCRGGGLPGRSAGRAAVTGTRRRRSLRSAQTPCLPR